jgi:RNA polymerase sigma-70 factor (ECF subfamily)
MSRPDSNAYDIDAIYARQVDVIYRVCFSYAKNTADTEDCVSETFMKLIKTKPIFNDTEHERAWLIRTATNVCKNYLKHWSRKNINIDECEGRLPTYDNVSETVESSEILAAVRALPERLVTPVYLFYYEGYSSARIAETLGKPDSTIRGYLREAKILLREVLQDYDYNREGALLS